MKAIRIHAFGGPEVLQFEDNLPDPIPGAGEVLIQVHAVGVNPVDTYIRAGIYGPRPFPYTPGVDAAGVVVAVGDGVESLKGGDRVYTAQTVTGAYADTTLAQANQTYPLPANVSFAAGAGVNVPYATAYRALFQRANAKAGETVLVHGASGGVGIAAVQLAKAYGLTVYGTASTDAGRALVQEQGAVHVFNHKEEGYLEEAQKTLGRGFDVIIEMLANVNLAKDMTALARFGRIVVVGSRGSVEVNPREVMSRDAAIFGMSLFNAPPNELREIHAALFAGLANGTLRPIVSREMPLQEAALAHIAIMESGTNGKIVLVP